MVCPIYVLLLQYSALRVELFCWKNFTELFVLQRACKYRQKFERKSINFGERF